MSTYVYMKILESAPRRDAWNQLNRHQNQKIGKENYE